MKPPGTRAIIDGMSNPSALDESMITALVDRFYDKVRADPMLGAVFNPVVHDWYEHKRTLVSFWCSVALSTNSYRGNPMAVHRAQPAIRAEHFEQWLALWRETTREILDESAAAQMIEYAERIGRSLRLGLGLPEHAQGQPFGVPIVGITR
jgi:hemoglobin